MSNLTLLSNRIEAAHGADRELDADIAEAVGAAPDGWMRVKGGWIHREGVGSRNAKRYTESLDAAMTLTNEKYRFHRVGAQIDDESQAPFVGVVTYFNEFTELEYAFGEAATPALALTAACLRALAHQGEGDV